MPLVLEQGSDLFADLSFTDDTGDILDLRGYTISVIDKKPSGLVVNVTTLDLNMLPQATLHIPSVANSGLLGAGRSFSFRVQLDNGAGVMTVYPVVEGSVR